MKTVTITIGDYDLEIIDQILRKKAYFRPKTLAMSL